MVPRPMQNEEKSPISACLIGASEARPWGLDAAERLRRALARLGLSGPLQTGDRPPEAGSIIMFRADYVVHEALIKALHRARNTLLVARLSDGRSLPVAAHVDARRAGEIADLLRRHPALTDAEAPADIAVVDPVGLASRYDPALRRRAAPYVLSLTVLTLREVEWRMFAASYKGVTDFVTKWLWPRPAFWVTRWCAAAGIAPNTVTLASLALALLALWYFWIGLFGLGIAAAWAMTFLDTVDGKLARVTLTSSRIGNALDHGIDLVHPPFWYWAWYVGLMRADDSSDIFLMAAAWTIILGYVVGRAQEGAFLWRFGIEMHAWRPIDSMFRLFTARRNPNLALMTVALALDALVWGFYAVAGWTVLSLAFHFWRLGQAFTSQGAGRAIGSWLAEP